MSILKISNFIEMNITHFINNYYQTEYAKEGFIKALGIELIKIKKFNTTLKKEYKLRVQFISQKHKKSLILKILDHFSAFIIQRGETNESVNNVLVLSELESQKGDITLYELTLLITILEEKYENRMHYQFST
ncbi:hypothetical protein Cyrtocomes_00893 [Candidatus Cyrtobacter comes]|uniref:Uncharacterized protein n=1 Tax=Candidatus Cyrtobacter comes TaxID=675776 RepID=A0ABU5L8R3_9RICK|nr:hypothetical protein [Candidatus Cyrtobacter comes]MDZ5762506.1 hypothetical protein [Candidatus Cyrtobacter comes]